VTKVEWYRNGVLAGSSSSASATFSWSTTASANGSYTIQAKAYDAAGNSGTSTAISVTVQNDVIVQNDATAPTVQITSPTAGSTVSGTVSVSVSASDNVGVTKVEWYRDGLLVGSSSSAPATFSWNTSATVNGSHSLLAKAYDAAGNAAFSASVTVTVQNLVLDTTAPTVQITSPSYGTTVTGVVSVNVASSDSVGITKVEWYLDGAMAGSSTSASASFSWDTTHSANGSHTLLAKAYDAAGNVGVSASITVTVQNATPDTSAPTVRITSPATGAKVSKSVGISVAASDNVGVKRVELFIDGKYYQSSTSASVVFSWNVSNATKGQHTLQAFAYDAAGNKGASAIVTVNK